jgi:toxin YoeB
MPARMSNLSFLPEAWEDYIYWQRQDKKTLKKINQLLQDMCRNAYEGLGKPEALSGNLSGWWSRRIDAANRLVYRLEGDTIIRMKKFNHEEHKGHEGA